MSCGWIGNVIGSNDKSHVCLREFRIDIIHFMKAIIRNIRFCKKDVHVPGHSTRNRMNCVLYGNSAFLKEIFKLPDFMLSLGDSHSIAWNNNHKTR